MKRSIHPTQDAFGVSLFYVQLMAMAQVASRLIYGPFTSHEFKDTEMRTLIFLVSSHRKKAPIGKCLETYDLVFDIHCCLHKGQRLKSCPTARPDHSQVLSTHLA